MRIALAQIDTTVGAFAENAAAVVAKSREAAERGAQLVVFPELTLCGYPPKDLLLLAEFIDRTRAALQRLAEDPVFSRVPALVGFAEPHRGEGAGLFNACALLHQGAVAAVGRKCLLPTYDVFDEARYFDPSSEVTLVAIDGVQVGLSICEDLWNDKQFWQQPRYARDPIEELSAKGAQLVVNLSASPFSQGKPQRRKEMVSAAARRHGLPIALCNLVGGNDSLIFDGRSVVFDARGESVAEAEAFEEDLLLVEVAPSARPRTRPATGTRSATPIPTATASPTSTPTSNPTAIGHSRLSTVDYRLSTIDGAADTNSSPGALALLSAYEQDFSDASCAELAQALALGIRDYARKTGFVRAVLGVSGGIDSALTAVLAARALGSPQVTAISMPSRYTASMSNEDAKMLASRLGIGFHTIPIEPMFQAYLEALRPVFEGRKPDVTEENLQARIRGMLLMAYSNKTGALLLSTGNKSELATGFCTLYGDMAGGLAAIGDLSKTGVYALARWFNRQGAELIPARILTRPPTAELRENQTDQDTLPPYEQLDRVLQGHIEERLGAQELAAKGLPEELVRRVLSLVVQSEYKRRQAAPSLRVSARAFGEGWRFPIAHGYRY